MAFKDTIIAFGKRFKLDSHHTMERFGVVCGIFAVTAVAVFGGSAFAAWNSGKEALANTSVYTPTFTTSKTKLKGDVDGVYTNELGNKALLIMHFDKGAKISYNAADYQGFLMGSDENLNTETVATPGISSSFHVFGSTGYIGVLFEADEPFAQQVLNLTMRANQELSFKESDDKPTDELAGDKSFAQHDQWRVFFNPGAMEAETIASLDAATFDPARAFYDVALKSDEQTAREALDSKLVEMRTALARIDSYTTDLETTKVDGLFLRPPQVPDLIAGDAVTGESKSESENGKSSLALTTKTVVPGGFDFNWRPGNVYNGYLDVLVPVGQSYGEFLSEKSLESTDEHGFGVDDIEWTLSDGSSLAQDYRTSDVTMRPLTNVMNNLSQAYADYYSAKNEYQSSLLFDLLALDVDLRDVQSNSSANSDEKFLFINY
ncbi:hypothetical protein [Nocardiopsis alborubida]|uniref:Uncharacterized protein n=1 Tax=Nocardiopsis alborubida TaxID=146802 RepID=A0A7X6RNB8_9ACTN|nr:hypothetical protein [Nocardiopsis alborubida]NKY96519.1 hypothetical protein [Nocardiopsis alborubida]